jgi:hypothetical protein
MTNLLFVPFPGSTLWPLAAPVESLKQAPDVARAVAPAERLFDDGTHPLQGPQRRGIAQGLRASHEDLLQAPQLRLLQPRTPTPVTRCPQTGRPCPLSRRRPSTDRLPSDPEITSNLRLRDPFFQQPAYLDPATLQLIDVPANTFWISHVSNVDPSGQVLTIVFEPQEVARA